MQISLVSSGKLGQCAKFTKGLPPTYPTHDSVKFFIQFQNYSSWKHMVSLIVNIRVWALSNFDISNNLYQIHSINLNTSLSNNWIKMLHDLRVNKTSLNTFGAGLFSCASARSRVTYMPICLSATSCISNLCMIGTECVVTCCIMQFCHFKQPLSNS